MGGPPEVGGAPVHLHTLHIPKATTGHRRKAGRRLYKKIYAFKLY